MDKHTKHSTLKLRTVLENTVYAVFLTLVGMQTSALALLVNQETGEGWKPEFDENGDVETPPDWVLAHNPGLQSFLETGVVLDTPQDTVLLDVDLCQSPLNEWISTSSIFTVEDEIWDPQVLNALSTEIGAWGDRKIADHLDSLDLSFDITSSPMTIHELECHACAMTYMQCLAQYRDGWLCKQYIYCNMTQSQPTSRIQVTVPLSADQLGLAGTLTVDGQMRYREIEEASGEILRQRCLVVEAHTAHDFGVWNALVEQEFESALDSEGRLCRFAGPDPSP